MTTKIDPRKLRHPEELARIEIKAVRVALHPQNDSQYAILEGPDKMAMLPLNVSEGANLTFASSKCSLKSYVNTLGQLLLTSMSDHGKTLTAVIVEAKDGDVYHGLVQFNDRLGRSFLATLAAGDAIYLGVEAKAPIYVTKNVWIEMDEFAQDWPADTVYSEE